MRASTQGGDEGVKKVLCRIGLHQWADWCPAFTPSRLMDQNGNKLPREAQWRTCNHCGATVWRIKDASKEAIAHKEGTRE